MNQNGYGKSVCPHLAGHIGSVYLKCCMIWQHKIALEMVCRADYGFWANVPAQGSGLRRATPQPTPRPGFRPPAQGSGLRRATPQPTTRPRFRAPPGYPPSPPPKIPLVCSSLFGPSPNPPCATHPRPCPRRRSRGRRTCRVLTSCCDISTWCESHHGQTTFR